MKFSELREGIASAGKSPGGRRHFLAVSRVVTYWGVALYVLLKTHAPPSGAGAVALLGLAAIGALIYPYSGSPVTAYPPPLRGEMFVGAFCYLALFFPEWAGIGPLRGLRWFALFVALIWAVGSDWRRFEEAPARPASGHVSAPRRPATLCAASIIWATNLALAWRSLSPAARGSMVFVAVFACGLLFAAWRRSEEATAAAP